MTNIQEHIELDHRGEYMNENHKNYFRQQLMLWKKALIAESTDTLDHLKEYDWSESDQNDAANMESEVSLELRTRDRYRKLLSKIEESLKKIDNDEYGFCEETGNPIGLKRLKARPIAALCLEAQERHENYEKQHIDMDLILRQSERGINTKA